MLGLWTLFYYCLKRRMLIFIKLSVGNSIEKIWEQKLRKVFLEKSFNLVLLKYGFVVFVIVMFSSSLPSKL